MNVVIRPSQDVFQRKARVLVMFGVFRRYDRSELYLPGEEARLHDMISKARNYRVQLAFCRQVSPEGNSYPGSWLPGCRPRITDMVFNYSGNDCFSHSEMLEAIKRFGRDEIVFSGPAHDSELQSGLERSAQFGLTVKSVSAVNALQICSTSGQGHTKDVYFRTQPGQNKATGYRDWISNLRVVEST